MKRAVLGFLFVVIAGTVPVAADEPTAGKTEIVVSGYGSVTLAPDMANVAAALETNAPSAAQAVSQNNAIYDRIVTALEKVGVARTDITLAYYSVNYTPKPAATAQPADQQYGFTVSRGFNVKVRDIGKAGRVVDAATSAGATAINGVTFGLADSTGARLIAARKAVDDARAGAEALAAAAHLRVTGISRIDLGGDGGTPVPMMRVAASNAPTQIDQSNVNVSVSVSVTFIAQP